MRAIDSIDVMFSFGIVPIENVEASISAIQKEQATQQNQPNADPNKTEHNHFSLSFQVASLPQLGLSSILW